MRLFARFFRLIWGGDVDRPLRPVLAVSFVGSTCFSAGWSFVGIWAIRGARGDQEPARGHLSDRRARRDGRRLPRRPRVRLRRPPADDPAGLGAPRLRVPPLRLRRRPDVRRSGAAGLLGDRRIDRRRGGPGDGRRPGAAGAPRGRLRVGAGGLEPRGRVRAADRRAPARRRALADPLRRRRVDVRRRDRDRLAVPAAARRVRAGGAADPRVARGDRARPRLPRLPGVRGSRLSGLRRDRDGAADLCGRHARCRSLGLGADRRPQPADGHALPASPYPRDHVVRARAEACDRHADDGRVVPAPARQQLGRDLRRRRARVRLRGDAVGADLPGDRRRARAGGRSRRLHGSVRLHGGDRVRPGAVHRPSLCRTCTGRTRPGCSSPPSRSPRPPRV